MRADRNEAIQWLRAIAATEVMVWHSDLVTKGFSAFSIQTSAFRPVGGIGVEVFFVVSGFLMSFISKSIPGAKPFLLGRIRRIYPLYWAFTLLVIGVYLVNPDWHLGGFSLSAGSIAGSLLLWPQQGYPILTVGWTLEYEIAFYLIVVAFIATTMSQAPRARAHFGVFLALLGLLGVCLPDALRTSPILTHILTPYMLAFGFGWLLHSAPNAGLKAAGPAFLVFTVLAAIGLAVAENHDAVVLPRSLAAGGFVAAMLALRPLLARTGTVNQIVAGIGEASYSIYLCHWFVLSALGKVFGRFDLPAYADVAIRVAGCLVALAVGWVFFIKLERPLDRRLRGQRKPAAGMVPAT